MKKILINANLGALTGLSYHRLIVPYVKVSDLEEFKCDVYTDVTMLSDEQIKDYHAVVYQREIDVRGRSLEIIQRFKRLGVKVIFDIDDYWKLPQTHHLYAAYKDFNIPKQTEEILKNVDLVTTTTEYLAEIIRGFNKNVEVLPNCLDPNEDQWKSNKIPSEAIRFGYIAGVHHVQDVKMLEMPIHKAVFSIDNAKFVLGGYTDNLHYKQYEAILSSDGWAKNKYQRINALPVQKYGLAYNHTDVSLIPLAASAFAYCKSEIKLLEAGMHGNAVIVSDCLPYSIFPKNTGIWVKAACTNDWYKAIKKYCNEPEFRKDKADELTGYVLLNYDLNKWTKVRKEILRRLLE